MEKRKKLCIFSKYSINGPSSHYRIMIFEDDLRKDYDVEKYVFWNEKYYSTYMSNKIKYIIPIAMQFVINSVKRLWQLYVKAPSCDIIFFQKAIIPGTSFHNLKYLKKRGCKLIIDIDDAIYLRKHDNSNRIAKYMDVIVVGNNDLKEYYKQYSSNVVILPTVEHTPDYLQYWGDTFANRTIVWIGSSSSVDNLDVVIDALNTIMEKHPDVKFKFICNESYGYCNLIPNAQFVRWSPDTVLKELSEATIGIMPLKNTEFNRGKCGFKLIQYLNMGKPVIASNVGVNREVVGTCGVVVNTTKEWYAAIESLLYNEELYRTCEQNIYNVFFKEYGYDVALDKLKCILEQVSL